jgi:hypothetical protein
LCITDRVTISEIAHIPAANVTDVAVKIGIAARQLRIHVGERLVELLLESAEQDCLRLTGPVLPEHS